MFNELFLPVLFAKLSTFRWRKPRGNPPLLWALIHGSHTFDAIKTLNIRSLAWLTLPVIYTHQQREIPPNERIKPTLIKVLWDISSFIFRPPPTFNNVASKCAQVTSRRHFLATERFCLPNVRYLQWRVTSNDRREIIEHAITLFSRLPQLTELKLTICYIQKDSMGLPTLSKLNTLRKLTFCIRNWVIPRDAPDYHHDLGSLRELLGCNPDLTHLTIHLDEHIDHLDLADIFSTVPTKKPLKLQHLGLSYQFRRGWDAAKIFPHIRCLTSVNLFFGRCDTETRASYTEFHNFWGFLAGMEVYPEHIKTSHVDHRFFNYLERHPNLVGLTLPNLGNYQSQFMKVLAQHAGTLEYLRMLINQLMVMLRVPENKRVFLQCAKMQQIYICKTGANSVLSKECHEDEQSFLDMVAHLNNRVILVIESYTLSTLCRKLCRDTHDPPQIELESRIFESLRGRKPAFWWMRD
ncbi:hypothetical protein AMATHDRAFT_70595 [Amanita thiersii Skay4041]|uniref:F-box domain-containing protein n=1 Tax=Amanita thiersii Skay4041 TaxID=703135 RepID=A0A2A9N7M7_9AGAR|nr:hypothetical protein AMATHDRAFT_70595 [Amanita thiersii Skay4041]